MRHLIDPLNFTKEETLQILDLATRISMHKSDYAHVADGKNLPLSFMSQAQEPVFRLSRLC